MVGPLVTNNIHAPLYAPIMWQLSRTLEPELPVAVDVKAPSQIHEMSGLRKLTNVIASGKDKVIGWCLVGLSSIIFIYYTIWVIILPFVDKGQRIHYLFPDIVYAVAIPLMTGVLGLLFIGSFIVITLLRAIPKDKSN